MVIFLAKKLRKLNLTAPNKGKRISLELIFLTVTPNMQNLNAIHAYYPQTLPGLSHACYQWHNS